MTTWRNEPKSQNVWPFPRQYSRYPLSYLMWEQRCFLFNNIGIDHRAILSLLIALYSAHSLTNPRVSQLVPLLPAPVLLPTLINLMHSRFAYFLSSCRIRIWELSPPKIEITHLHKYYDTNYSSFELFIFINFKLSPMQDLLRCNLKMYEKQLSQTDSLTLTDAY